MSGTQTPVGYWIVPISYEKKTNDKLQRCDTDRIANNKHIHE